MNETSPLFPELIRTKLHPPPVTGALMRPRLVAQLDDGLDFPLTLICTPAGFGKTTLLSTWFEQLKHRANGAAVRTAWYSLDEGDNDLQVFLRYLVTAVSRAYPNTCGETLELLRAPLQPQARLLNTAFVNDLESLPGPLVLVLDDYHAADAEPVHELLRELCRHWPRPLHLILTSRKDPPLPIARLRAQNFVHDIRTRDLRFSADETRAYLATNLNASLSDDALTQLHERTEGWIAGLHLAALSLAASDDPEQAVEQLGGTDIFIASYLVDEVLGQQPPGIRDLLLVTSLFERFSAGLAHAVLNKPGQTAAEAQDAILRLERANLFVVPLDQTRTWYRYHALFQELLAYHLQATYSGPAIAAIHSRAAVWFASQGHTDEALRHALAAPDTDLAVEIIEAGLREALNREDRATLERWLKLLPAGLVDGQPALLIFKAWALQFSWQLAAQGKVLQQLERLLSALPYPVEDHLYIREQMNALYAQTAYLTGRPEEAAALSADNLRVFPYEWRYVRGGAGIYIGMAMQACGQSAEAEQLLAQLYAESPGDADGFTLRLLLSLCFIHYLDGETGNLLQTAHLLKERAANSTLVTMRSWASTFLGFAHYAQNNLDAAATSFTDAIAHRFSAQALTGRASYAGLAHVRLAQGNLSEALNVCNRMSEYDLTVLSTETPETRSLRAALHLAAGQTANAAHWANSFTTTPTMQPFLWPEEPRLTWAKILIALRKPDDVDAALGYLNDLLEQALHRHNRFFQVRIRVLRAQALTALTPPQAGAASEELQRALDLAEAGELVQPFLEAGPGVIELLGQLVAAGGGQPFITRILAAHSARATGTEAATPPADTVRIEPLTPREQDVLALMRLRLTDKEIAQRLSISVQTAKRHAANIYVKLGVSRRWDAVSMAEAHGLLPPANRP